MRDPFKFASYKLEKHIYLPSWKILKLHDFLKSVTDVQILCKKSLFHAQTTDHNIHNSSYGTSILRRNKNYSRMDTIYLHARRLTFLYMMCDKFKWEAKIALAGFAKRKGGRKRKKRRVENNKDALLYSQILFITFKEIKLILFVC